MSAPLKLPVPAISKVRAVLSGAILCLGCFSVMAQPNNGFGNFRFLPQRTAANPALRPLADINIAVPALGMLQFDHHNNWVRPTMAFSDAGSGQTTFDAPAVLNQIDEAAVTYQSLSINLMHVGLRIKKHYFHLSVNERVQARIDLPADLFYLAVYGNAGEHAFANNTADFSALAVNAVHYREYALGYGRNIGEKWAVGATFKVLYGMENIHTATSSLQLHTDPDTYALRTSGALAVNTSGLDLDEENSDRGFGAYAFGKSNGGAAMDVGAVFRPLPKLSVSASVHDLGWIKWKSDVANYGTKNADFLYDGFDVGEYLFTEEGDFSDSLEYEAEAFVDELESRYGFDKTEGAYTTLLQGYVRYGASYELWRTAKLRGMATLEATHGLGGGQIPFRVTAGYHQRVGNTLEAGVHLTKRSAAKIGLGGGMAVNIGFFQVFAMVDNINFARLVRINHTDDEGTDTTLVLPENSDDVRFSFGMNLVFGREKVLGEGGTASH